jgi:hypothetical protein
MRLNSWKMLLTGLKRRAYARTRGVDEDDGDSLVIYLFICMLIQQPNVQLQG